MNSEQRNLYKTLMIVSGFVFEIFAILFIGYMMGHLLDEWLNTTPWFTLISMLGWSFYALYRLVKRVDKIGGNNGKK